MSSRYSKKPIFQRIQVPDHLVCQVWWSPDLADSYVSYKLAERVHRKMKQNVIRIYNESHQQDNREDNRERNRPAGNREDNRERNRSAGNCEDNRERNRNQNENMIIAEGGEENEN